MGIYTDVELTESLIHSPFGMGSAKDYRSQKRRFDSLLYNLFPTNTEAAMNLGNGMTPVGTKGLASILTDCQKLGQHGNIPVLNLKKPTSAVLSAFLRPPKR